MKKSKKKTDPLERDLSPLLERSDWKKIQYENKPKNKIITLRLSEDLIQSVKEKADREGIDYQKWICLTLAMGLTKAS